MRPTIAPALTSIDLSSLSTVIGGCGKKCAQPQPQPQPQPQQAAPAPAAGPEVSTNVSITGYGQQQ